MPKGLGPKFLRHEISTLHAQHPEVNLRSARQSPLTLISRGVFSYITVTITREETSPKNRLANDGGGQSADLADFRPAKAPE